jgi:hypothetical protein
MVQSSGRFKTVHTGCYLSAKAYGAACDEPLGHELEAEWLEAERLSRVVHRFETALYEALFRGQSKKDISMLGFPWVPLGIATGHQQMDGSARFSKS